jgi:hypothetical protein
MTTHCKAGTAQATDQFELNDIDPLTSGTGRSPASIARSPRKNDSTDRA